jgi:hypothetical protein
VCRLMYLEFAWDCEGYLMQSSVRRDDGPELIVESMLCAVQYMICKASKRANEVCVAYICNQACELTCTCLLGFN